MTPREILTEADRLRGLANDARRWYRYMKDTENIDTQPNDRYPANVRVSNRVMPLHVRLAAMPALLEYAGSLEDQATALESTIGVITSNKGETNDQHVQG